MSRSSRVSASGSRRRWTFVLTWLLMLGILVGGGVVSAALLHDRRLADHHHEIAVGADRAAQELSESLGRTVARLEGAGALVTADGVVAEAQYGSFAESLALHPPVVASALVLLVDNADREQFEETTGITIVERTPGEEPRIAPRRPTYAPIVAIAPAVEGSRDLLGFDYFGEEVRAEALRRAWETGETGVSGRTTRALTGEDGFLVIQPLWHPDTSEPSRPIGFIAVSYDASDLGQLLELRSGAVVSRIETAGEVLHERPLPAGATMTERTVEAAGTTWTVHVAASGGVSLWPPVLVIIVSVVLALLVGEIIRRSWRYERSLAWWSRSMEDAQQRTEDLRRLTDSLRRTEDLGELAQTALERSAVLLEATWCRLQIESDDGTIVAAAERGAPAGKSLQRLPLRTATTNHGVMVVEPGVVDLPLASRTMRATVAGLVADAASRTKRRQAEHELAASLQRMLLPRLPGTFPFGEIAATYRPLSSSAVGGDWFDVIQSGDTFVLIVGDVVGKGPRAAGAMGNLRIACRMIEDACQPGRILDQLDSVAIDLEDAFMATAVVIVVDRVSREIRYSRAGHPSPLLLLDGTSQWLDGALGPPLGLSDGPRSAAALSWDGPLRLLAYTDGLIEHRGQSMDVGFELLASAATREATRALPEFCDAVVDALLDGLGRSDDVAALAADLRAPDEVEWSRTR